MAPRPIVLPHALPTDLLTYVLTHHSCSTTLIICELRKKFLESVTSTLRSSSRHLPTEEKPQLEQDGLEDTTPMPRDSTDNPTPERDPGPTSNGSVHPLLINTIHQLVTSRSINTVFIPTISHLRAYLATFPNSSTSPHVSPSSTREWDKSSENCPVLVVYGMLELHRDTSEWSAQGLGSTLASLVQVGSLSGQKVVIIERKFRDDYDDDDGMDTRVREEEELEIKEEKENPWEELVPLLSGSVRRAGLDVDSQGWSGRTVKLGRILRRWFVSERGDWS